MVERVIDGQKRVFQAPKQAELTEQGQERLKKVEEDLDEYENLTHRELVEKVHQLEDQVEDLEGRLSMFRKQVQEKL
jgi:polyhydroxyalkanoate synthesis regulator phasin